MTIKSVPLSFCWHESCQDISRAWYSYHDHPDILARFQVNGLGLEVLVWYLDDIWIWSLLHLQTSHPGLILGLCPAGCQIRIFLRGSNGFPRLYRFGVCKKVWGFMLCLDILASHFHGETWIPKCISSGNPLKKMGFTNPQLPFIWQPGPANERRCYKVTPFLIGWAQT